MFVAWRSTSWQPRLCFWWPRWSIAAKVNGNPSTNERLTYCCADEVFGTRAHVRILETQRRDDEEVQVDWLCVCPSIQDERVGIRGVERIRAEGIEGSIPEEWTSSWDKYYIRVGAVAGDILKNIRLKNCD